MRDHRSLHPGGELVPPDRSRCHAENDHLRIVDRSVEFEAVEHEKHFDRCMADALVSVDERMIADQ